MSLRKGLAINNWDNMQIMESYLNEIFSNYSLFFNFYRARKESITISEDLVAKSMVILNKFKELDKKISGFVRNRTN